MKSLKLFVVGFVVVLLGLSSTLPINVSADFNANDLIDDAVFDNAGSMTSAQIDTFLNGFSSSCISSNGGFRAIDPVGYNPSQGYQYGGYVTAGQVIYDASQAYNLNPQVLLATLEKEQSLITGQNDFNGYCNNGQQHKYAAALGYGCPDSGTSYSYSGLNLYQRNGTTITDTGTTCVNDSKKAGFTQQVIRATWLLKFAEQRSEGNTGWAVIKGAWNNSDDPNSCYSGPMTPGYRKRCASDTNATYYDGYLTIDGTSTQVQSGATAALYWYTPHFHGNQNFVSLFEQWFGPTHNSFAANSPYAKSSCNIPDFNSDMVGRLYNPERKDFLFTTSHLEACLAPKAGYIWDGLVFANYTPSTDTTPVYRLANFARHLYTSSSTIRQDYLTNKGYHDEGIAFYAKTTASPNIPVYCLVNGDTVTYTNGDGESYLLQSEGYTNAGIAFYTGQLPNSTVSLYRLSNGAHRLYTIDGHEKDVAQLFYGFTWETNSTTKVYPNPGPSLAPVYRLSSPGHHFYTTNRGERDMAVVFYGYMSEGTGFYAPVTASNDGSTSPIYRLTDRNGNRLFTASSVERDTAVQYYGFTYEAIGWYSPN